MAAEKRVFTACKLAHHGAVAGEPCKQSDRVLCSNGRITQHREPSLDASTHENGPIFLGGGHVAGLFSANSRAEWQQSMTVMMIKLHKN